jgi:hypothetical protein
VSGLKKGSADHGPLGGCRRLADNRVCGIILVCGIHVLGNAFRSKLCMLNRDDCTVCRSLISERSR